MRTTLLFFLALAGVLAAAEPPAAGPEQVADLIGQLDGEGMASQVRAKAAYRQLVQIGQPAVQPMLDALKGPSPWVRLWCAAALADLGEERAIEPMLKMLDDPHTVLRNVVTHHVSRFHERDPRIAPAIARRLADAAPEVRDRAARTLQRIKFQGAIPEVRKVLDGPSREGRGLALKLLVQHEGKEPLAEIQRALQDKDWRRRSAAVCAIGHGVMHANEDTFDALLGALDDPSDEVRADAVEVLNGILAEIMDRMPADLRQRVLAELDRKLPPLLDAKLPRLRGWALFLLAAGQREAVYPRALAGLDDPDAGARALAFKAVGRCGRKTQEVVDKAVANLDHADRDVRNVAFATLRWATGGTYDYSPSDPAEERQAKIAKIRDVAPKAGRPAAP